MKIIVTPIFEKDYKRLSKKYRSLKKDIQSFCEAITENPEQGVLLSGGFRKIRLAITSKGKSGGARVITYNYFVDKNLNKIILVTMYDKEEQASISESEIAKAYKSLNE